MQIVSMLSDVQMNRKIASLPGVQTVIKAKAEEMGGIAEGLLAPHRRTGLTHIEVNHRLRGMRYKKYDSFVSLVAGPGESALAIETGHVNSGEYEHLAPAKVSGIWVLRRTMAASGALGGYNASGTE